MAKRERLRWIPMLIEAYRQAKERTGIHHELTTVSSQSELPISRASSNMPRRQPEHRTGAARRPVKPQPRGRNVVNFNDSQRLIRELRTGNRKSWGRLESIEQKIKHVESKIESLQEDLRQQSQNNPENTQRPPAQMTGHPTMPPDFPHWL